MLVFQLTDLLMITVCASFMASDRWFIMAAKRPLLTPPLISWRRKRIRA